MKFLTYCLYIIIKIRLKFLQFKTIKNTINFASIHHLIESYKPKILKNNNSNIPERKNKFI